MQRLSRIKAEHLLIRQGLRQALDYFDQTATSHPLYTRDFSLNVVLTAHAMLNIEQGPQLEINLLLASLFLRMPTRPEYDFMHTVEAVRRFFKRYPNIGNADRVISYILDQETEMRPVTAMGNVLHDAEILTFLIQPPSSIIEFVQQKLGRDVIGSRLFLERIVVSQTMYTSLGRDMLRDLSASILVDLRA
ncbi:hypothetical protein pEaSNUABM28_00219 [Erwinia phage pEa_SNUABM_28]|uniref:Uncharacterized protein n=1 Tax=Erwinia phage pEa_SNUABM_16 TaxID=2869544 RepID=A0AAE8XQ87_9CAUD|nr:hypothetical protein MPK64_gp217 [Erwinia phage pEa_SNUABM_16]QZE58776.1 hypothetical protein pEaSNUABM28_00219 [Erwinia phage pEa_SNUABM_28]QZE59120.1 hypothetical protein pEaSNUABM18_00217 [Erwinia phage pEa_SNUABM_18]UAW96361.1 hypothetical protein pEaSNUABM16_00217 [Erwinia phage pEa_SNUABM_16]